MPDTVSDRLIRRLKDWGVTRLYGYPGDGFNAILGALQRAGNEPRFVQTRHEEMAAFMAGGQAKFTGEPGVCMATSGAGAIHLLNGLYDAKLEHQPVVAIVGQSDTTAMGTSYLQEVDLHALFQDVGAYVQTVMAPEQLPVVVDRAFRTAITDRTVTVLIFPADVQEAEYTPPRQEFKMVPGGGTTTLARPRVVPDPDEVRYAADILNEGERVAILVGQGARGAVDKVVEVADRLGAGVAKALLGKDVLSDDLPFVTGPIGMLGSKASWELMQGCDTFLMIGSSFPYSEFLPPYGQARGIQIDIDGKMIGLRYPMEVNLLGDADATLGELLPLLERKQDRSWRERIEKEVDAWWNLLEARAMQDADPINPQRVFWELSPKLPDDAIVTSDAGTAADWYARDLRFRGDMRGSLSGTLATMGSAVPYAIAAKFSHPHRPVIATVGDGAMQMNGNAELLTIARYWREWDDPRLIVLVLHNHDLNHVTWEMRALEGMPKFEETQDLPEMSYAAYADLVGLEGITLDDPADIASTWDRALTADHPVVIDAIVDAAVPPIPPQVDIGTRAALARSILRRDPDAGGVIRQGTKDKLQEFRPST